MTQNIQRSASARHPVKGNNVNGGDTMPEGVRRMIEIRALRFPGLDWKVRILLDRIRDHEPGKCTASGATLADEGGCSPDAIKDAKRIGQAWGVIKVRSLGHKIPRYGATDEIEIDYGRVYELNDLTWEAKVEIAEGVGLTAPRGENMGRGCQHPPLGAVSTPKMQWEGSPSLRSGDPSQKLQAGQPAPRRRPSKRTGGKTTSTPRTTGTSSGRAMGRDRARAEIQGHEGARAELVFTEGERDDLPTPAEIMEARVRAWDRSDRVDVGSASDLVTAYAVAYHQAYREGAHDLEEALSAGVQGRSAVLVGPPVVCAQKAIDRYGIDACVAALRWKMGEEKRRKGERRIGWPLAFKVGAGSIVEEHLSRTEGRRSQARTPKSDPPPPTPPSDPDSGVRPAVPYWRDPAYAAPVH